MKKNKSIFEISPLIYEKLSELIVEEVKTPYFRRIYIELEHESVLYILTTTVVAKFKTEQFPERSVECIDELRAVWWELHTHDESGEILNDFDFTILTQYICNN